MGQSTAQTEGEPPAAAAAAAAAAAEKLPLLLLVVSPAAAAEVAPWGGNALLRQVAQQLLQQLGSVPVQETAEETLEATRDEETVRLTSWRCSIRNKYYSAPIRAVMLQLPLQQQEQQQQQPQPKQPQLQQLHQQQEEEQCAAAKPASEACSAAAEETPLRKKETLEAAETPEKCRLPAEAVVFICSKQERDKLLATRRLAEAEDEDRHPNSSRLLLPLHCMRNWPVAKQQQQQQQQEQQEMREGEETGDTDDWWVRDVPLKFIVFIHCSTSSYSSSWGCSRCSRGSAVLAGNGETEVWLFLKDVFIEGVELCLNTKEAAAASSDAAAAAAAVPERQQQRLRAVAEALQCHMWPGLTKCSSNITSSSSNSNSNNSCSSSNGSSSNSTSMKRGEQQSEQQQGVDTSAAASTAGAAAGVRERPREGPAVPKAAPAAAASASASATTTAATEAEMEEWESLAAAMMQLKHSGSSVSSQSRRHKAMYLASQLAALSRCDDE
ncbi:hypothetical protein, conserved [Eimeria acervulina]|uniref:Uncharacterized protein n=1 Tax=Eimeria acervulina TaxID=5801 RepID=U6GNE3_EIMAC|nr:hypothetical protein, conserved [Eimeria acervulina]CDI81082.1 hypothetical protein, conserved [Eimeria acervulina]